MRHYDALRTKSMSDSRITQRFPLLIFSCLMKKIVLPLIMKTEKNSK